MAVHPRAIEDPRGRVAVRASAITEACNCRSTSIGADVGAVARYRAPTLFFGADEKRIRAEKAGFWIKAQNNLG